MSRGSQTLACNFHCDLPSQRCDQHSSSAPLSELVPVREARLTSGKLFLALCRRVGLVHV